MKITFTKAPTFTKSIIASAVFAIVYLASTSNLPPCSDTTAILSSGGGECIERQSFLHTASGWLALICLVAAALLLALKHKDSIRGWQGPAQQAAPQQVPIQQVPVQQAHQGPSEWAQAAPPATAPGRPSVFCARCGTRIFAGDRFCQGCGAESQQS